MLPKEVEAILKPIYEKFQEHCKSGNVDESVKYYHSQAVVVEKGKKVWYGKEEICTNKRSFRADRDAEGVFWIVESPTFAMSNEVYQGTNDYLILHCDFEINSKKTSYKMKLVHIWKKEDGSWKLYHEECESS